MRSSRRPILWCLLLAALALAGCGGPDRAEYQRDLARVGSSVESALDALPDSDRATLGSKEVATIADDLREAADELEGLDAPDDARKPQRRLVKGMRGVGRAFDRLADDLADTASDQGKAELFVSFLTDTAAEAAFEDIAEAQAAYVDAGYRVFRAGDKGGATTDG